MKILHTQHAEDLHSYRSSHRHLTNRHIHWVMVPLECWSLFSMISLFIPMPLALCVGVLLGSVSVTLATHRGLRGVGAVCFLFHIGTVFSCEWILNELEDPKYVAFLASSAWTVAWFLQVCIGHWVIERNQPTIADSKSSVSPLAMLFSVLIVWSS